jgi:transposase
MPKTHPPYPAEYRRRMVEQVRAGRSLKELAREFEPSVESIRKRLDNGSGVNREVHAPF